MNTKLAMVRAQDVKVAKFASFRATNGHAPEPYVDYDPDGTMCQDDYEYLTGTGLYSDEIAPE